MSRVQFTSEAVLIDAKPVQLISGAIHYFRVPAELWRDRLQKAVQCGLNAVETYMCWNLHEPQQGDFRFDDMLDFARFIRTAGELGLYVIVRPGPYICAEWENGGLPAWLTAQPDIELRRMNKPYLAAVERYLSKVLPLLAPLQLDNGGPVVAFQIENEYGSYGHDKQYLAALRDAFRAHGITVPLFTADGGDAEFFINGGNLPGTPIALTFGSRGLANFARGKALRPDSPSLCMEFWDGWFDAWGCGSHRTRPADEVADELDDMLGAGGSVNFYMFHGGTNFGFMNGANATPGLADYAPHTTSYDYDSPLSECGDPTEKFFAIQKVIRKYRPDAPFGTPAPSPKADYGKLPLAQTAPYFANLEQVAASHATALTAPTMEQLGQAFGFVHYRTRLDGPVPNAALVLRQVNDRAIVFLDGQYRATIYRNDAFEKHELPPFDIPADGMTLDLLVENTGRVNYGPLLGKDPKGIVGSVTITLQQQFDWDVWSLPLEYDQLKSLRFNDFCWNDNRLPAFHRATLEIADEPRDTFLVRPGVKGLVWLNGHNLGRYWNVGPTRTLYVPGCWLKQGANEVVVFELERLEQPYLRFDDHPDLG